MAHRTVTTGNELEDANAELGRVLGQAEKLLAKRFPGISGRVPLVASPNTFLEFRRDKLRLWNGKVGPRAAIFPIDVAAPHQRIVMAANLQPLYQELQNEGANVVQEVRRAIAVAKEFNRSH